MHGYRACSDDFYINLNLNTEMELIPNRETILHYFEQLQKRFPSMRNFYCRERGEHVLEEDKGRGQYRWATVELKRICSGHVNPDSIEDALEQHELVLELAPYALSMSPLDCESLNLMYGFDFTYRGNHNQLVVDALGLIPALEGMMHYPGATAIAFEPSIQIATDEDCRVQCRLSIETRTSAYHVRTGEFPEDQLSVYVTARRYSSLDPGETFVHALHRLQSLCSDVIDNHVAPHVLRPLQQAIAMK
jgi:hypothetical protein